MGFFAGRRLGVATHKFFTFVFNGSGLPPRQWENDNFIIPPNLSPSGKRREVLRTSSENGQKMAKGAMMTGVSLKNKICQSKKYFTANPKPRRNGFWTE
jgi:hypothetical protein